MPEAEGSYNPSVEEREGAEQNEVARSEMIIQEIDRLADRIDEKKLSEEGQNDLGKLLDMKLKLADAQNEYYNDALSQQALKQLNEETGILLQGAQKHFTQQETADATRDETQKVSKGFIERSKEGVKDIWRGVTEEPSVRKIIAKTGIGIISSYLGLKLVTDLFLEKENIVNYVREKLGSSKERKEIEKLAQTLVEAARARKMEEGPRWADESVPKEERVRTPESEMLRNRAQEYNKKINSAEYLSEDEKADFRKRLGSILAERINAERDAKDTLKKSTNKALGAYITNKIKGTKIARDALNLGLTASGLILYRGVSYSGMALVEKEEEARAQWRKERLRQSDKERELALLYSMQREEKETTKETKNRIAEKVAQTNGAILALEQKGAGKTEEENKELEQKKLLLSHLEKASRSSADRLAERVKELERETEHGASYVKQLGNTLAESARETAQGFNITRTNVSAMRKTLDVAKSTGTLLRGLGLTSGAINEAVGEGNMDEVGDNITEAFEKFKGRGVTGAVGQGYENFKEAALRTVWLYGEHKEATPVAPKTPEEDIITSPDSDTTGVTPEEIQRAAHGIKFRRNLPEQAYIIQTKAEQDQSALEQIKTTEKVLVKFGFHKNEGGALELNMLEAAKEDANLGKLEQVFDRLVATELIEELGKDGKLSDDEAAKILHISANLSKMSENDSFMSRTSVGGENLRGLFDKSVEFDREKGTLSIADHEKFRRLVELMDTRARGMDLQGAKAYIDNIKESTWEDIARAEEEIEVEEFNQNEAVSAAEKAQFKASADSLGKALDMRAVSIDADTSSRLGESTGVFVMGGKRFSVDHGYITSVDKKELDHKIPLSETDKIKELFEVHETPTTDGAASPTSEAAVARENLMQKPIEALTSDEKIVRQAMENYTRDGNIRHIQQVIDSFEACDQYHDVKPFLTEAHAHTLSDEINEGRGWLRGGSPEPAELLSKTVNLAEDSGLKAGESTIFAQWLAGEDGVLSRDDFEKTHALLDKKHNIDMPRFVEKVHAFKGAAQNKALPDSTDWEPRLIKYMDPTTGSIQEQIANIRESNLYDNFYELDRNGDGVPEENPKPINGRKEKFFEREDIEALMKRTAQEAGTGDSSDETSTTTQEQTEQTAAQKREEEAVSQSENPIQQKTPANKTVTTNQHPATSIAVEPSNEETEKKESEVIHQTQPETPTKEAGEHAQNNGRPETLWEKRWEDLWHSARIKTFEQSLIDTLKQNNIDFDPANGIDMRELGILSGGYSLAKESRNDDDIKLWEGLLQKYIDEGKIPAQNINKLYIPPNNSNLGVGGNSVETPALSQTPWAQRWEDLAEQAKDGLRDTTASVRRDSVHGIINQQQTGAESSEAQPYAEPEQNAQPDEQQNNNSQKRPTADVWRNRYDFSAAKMAGNQAARVLERDFIGLLKEYGIDFDPSDGIDRQERNFLSSAYSRARQGGNQEYIKAWERLLQKYIDEGKIDAQSVDELYVSE